MMAYQDMTKETKLVNSPVFKVTKLYQTLVLALNAAFQTIFLPFNVGRIVLRNHAGAKDIEYTTLVMIFLQFKLASLI